MNRKIAVVLLLLTSVILAGVPESFARPQYLTNLTAVYGDGSCGACHIRASGGGPRNTYGTLFENQPNHATDPGAALTTIGPPPTATLTSTATPIATETPAEPAAPEVTTVTATGTPAAPGFGFVAALVGLFSCALLARRYNK